MQVLLRLEFERSLGQGVCFQCKMQLDDWETRRICEARNDFDNRNTERISMHVGTFHWAAPGGNLVERSGGSVPDYSDGRVPKQKEWEYVGGGWKPGGAARAKETKAQRVFDGVRRTRWNTTPGAPVTRTLRRQYSGLPGVQDTGVTGGATSGTTHEMAQQMLKTYRQRLQTREDTIVENGWGERPGEEAGTTRRSAHPATAAALGVALNPVRRSAQQPAAPPPPVAPSVARLSDDLFRAVTQPMDAAGAQRIIDVFQGILQDSADALVSADTKTLKAWQETARDIVARYGGANLGGVALQTILMSFQELARLQQLYAEHGVKRVQRNALVTAAIQGLVSQNPSNPIAVQQLLRNQALRVAMPARDMYGAVSSAVDSDSRSWALSSLGDDAYSLPRPGEGLAGDTDDASDWQTAVEGEDDGQTVANDGASGATVAAGTPAGDPAYQAFLAELRALVQELNADHVSMEVQQGLLHLVITTGREMLAERGAIDYDALNQIIDDFLAEHDYYPPVPPAAGPEEAAAAAPGVPDGTVPDMASPTAPVTPVAAAAPAEQPALAPPSASGGLRERFQAVEAALAANGTPAQRAQFAAFRDAARAQRDAVKSLPESEQRAVRNSIEEHLASFEQLAANLQAPLSDPRTPAAQAGSKRRRGAEDESPLDKAARMRLNTDLFNARTLAEVTALASESPLKAQAIAFELGHVKSTFTAVRKLLEEASPTDQEEFLRVVPFTPDPALL